MDVIIRRVDDTWCDPLELRGDSILGVPGLVEAARAGHVAISNALGAGAVETTAILAFLPALARHLLGEKLLIPNVATWWCGQESEAQLRALRARSAASSSAPSSAATASRASARSSTPPSSTTLAARIRANPHAYVGQERVALSTAPVWNGERARAAPAHPALLRLRDAGRLRGHARRAHPRLAGRRIRRSSPRATAAGARTPGCAPSRRWKARRRSKRASPSTSSSAAPSQVPSRVVENLFWLGRYAERLEDTTRLLRTALGRLAGEGGPSRRVELAALVRWLVAVEMLPAAISTARSIPCRARSELRELVFERNRTGTVRDLLGRVGFLTASVRDRLSGDTWRILNQIQTEFPAVDVAGHARRDPADAAPAHLSARGLQRHGDGKHDARPRVALPRHRPPARARDQSRDRECPRASSPPTRDGAALPPLLEYTDSTMTYRRRYLARPELPPTLALLLADDDRIRARSPFNSRRSRRHFGELPGAGEAAARGDASSAKSSALLTDTDVPALAEDGAPRRSRAARHAARRSSSPVARALSRLLSASYFSHVPARVS